MTQNLPPNNNEIEVSVFGPGVGECILIHTGNQKWVIIDSCIDLSNNQPAPISYLNRLGLNSQEVVKLIVASHWHDDHVRGLSEVIGQCGSSRFVCSGALNSEEFRMFISAFTDQASLSETGVDEINKVFDLLIAQGKSLKFASENLPLYETDSHEANSIKCRITALSPSDKSILLSKQEIGQLIPKTKKIKKWISPQSPNHYSVVLWIDFGYDKILLGADLESIKDSDRGWMAIIGSNLRPSGEASVFKIPHHGSGNADHPQIWNSLTKKNPFAILTPFSRLKKPLPTPTDINRILGKTNEAYLTANPTNRRRIKRSNTVERLLRESGCKIYREVSSMGQVRLRGKMDRGKINWNVSLFDGAFKLI